MLRMVSKKRLSDVEKGMILAMHHELRSQREIARTLGRSRYAVQRFLKNQEPSNQREERGTRPKLSPTQKRAMLREASKGNSSASDLRKELQLPVSVRRVQQIMHDSPHLCYRKRKSAPYMLQRHKDKRLQWSRDHVTWPSGKWERVIFSDEKKFNLDGPDGLSYYWHDIRKEEKIFSKRQQGGDSLMLWGAISYFGLSDLRVVKGNMDSIQYCEVLEENLDFSSGHTGESWIFQQDGASVHRSVYTNNWLRDRNIETLDWPAKSPDLNIIENVWGIMARRVYKNCRQFNDVEELSNCVRDVWRGISEEYIQGLYKSIPRRLVQVLEKKGGRTSY